MYALVCRKVIGSRFYVCLSMHEKLSVAGFMYALVCRKVASGKFSVFIYGDFYCILLVA